MVISASQNELSPQKIERIGERFDMFHTVLDEYCTLINSLSDNLPINIVVRPHPAEKNCSFWVDKFKEKKNVYVCNVGDANAWIYSSELMIHSGCTTAYESCVLNKPSIYYNPIMEKAVGSEFSMKANTIPDVINLIKKMVSGETDTKQYLDGTPKQFMHELTLITEDKSSSERIADVLDEFESVQYSKPINLGQNSKTRLIMLKNLIKHLLGKYWNSKFEYTTRKEVMDIVTNSAIIMNYKEKILVNHPDTNTFIVKKK